MGYDSFACVTWIIHTETCLIHMWDMTHSHVSHGSFICETCLIHMWDMCEYKHQNSYVSIYTQIVYGVHMSYNIYTQIWVYIRYIHPNLGVYTIHTPKFGSKYRIYTQIWVYIRYTATRCNTCDEWMYMSCDVWMSHVTHMNEARHTYEWGTAHIWMRHVTHTHAYVVWRVDELCHTYAWVTSHSHVSHETYTGYSRVVIWVYVTWGMWMSHVTHMNESWHTYEWGALRMCMNHGTRMWHTCAMTHGTRMSHTCAMTRRMSEARCACACVASHIKETRSTTYRIWLEFLLCETGMRCLQLVGSLELQVSFAEYSLFYMALVQKRPIILRSLLIVATP